MGISIQEFQMAMEVFGARRLNDGIGTRYNISVPCFEVKDTIFLHSGSYYVVQRGTKVTEQIMNRAMAEFEEEYPGGDNFWYNEIHSVKGILTLVLMLNNQYSKEIVNRLTSETYQKLLQIPLIQQKFDKTQSRVQDDRYKNLTERLEEFDTIVNPFIENNFKFQEPSQYLDKIAMKISYFRNADDSILLSISVQQIEMIFRREKSSWRYSIEIRDNLEETECYTYVVHFCNNENDSTTMDEVIFLEKRTNECLEISNDIDLRISLKNGLAWETYNRIRAKPATDEQIEIMMMYLSDVIEKAKTTIINNMIRK